MPTIKFFLSPLRVKALPALALAFALVAPKAEAVTPSPFRNFMGQWSGSGQIVASDGHREQIRCRAEYSGAKDGAALNQAIVCASESFRLDIKSYVEASGDSVQGTWNEASRGVSGHLTGRVAENRFEGQIDGGTFTAAVSLTSNGRTQGVSIRPSGGDITDVRIELRRRG
ncbi:hypothetical protein [Roseiarcus sp.]|uniref:hypothetical protein n=1 Tax=Roseiarcus sp. TaxID=1969460 RepID=UPI003F9BD52C